MIKVFLFSCFERMRKTVQILHTRFKTRNWEQGAYMKSSKIRFSQGKDPSVYALARVKIRDMKWPHQ